MHCLITVPMAWLACSKPSLQLPQQLLPLYLIPGLQLLDQLLHLLPQQEHLQSLYPHLNQTPCCDLRFRILHPLNPQAAAALRVVSPCMIHLLDQPIHCLPIPELLQICLSNHQA